MEGSQETKSRPLALYPLGVAAFPVLALYAHNAHYSPPGEVVTPLLGMLGATLVLVPLLRLLLGDWHKAAAAVSILLVILFSYGPLHELVGEWRLFGIWIGRARNLLALLVVLSAVVVWRVHRSRRDFAVATPVLNRIAVGIVVIPVLGAAVRLISQGRPVLPDRVVEAESLRMPDPLPDIYLIVLDGHGRADALREFYGLDISENLAALRDLGFVVAEQSTTNYSKTMQTLSSMLNMVYLDDVAAELGADHRGLHSLSRMIAQGTVPQVLRERGYEFVCFSSGWHPTEITHADQFLSARRGLTEFESGLLNFTPIPTILYKSGIWKNDQFHRGRVLHVLETLPRLAEDDVPQFVLAHVICPHQPFVFDADGGEVPAEDQWRALSDVGDIPDKQLAAYRAWMQEGYPPQVRFILDRIHQALAETLAKARTPPVVVLMGDHGPDSTCHWAEPSLTCLRERLPILNAYYLPGPGEAEPYPAISPVNSFRLIFNRYFGADLSLLPDRSYWVDNVTPFALREVTEEYRQAVEESRGPRSSE